MRTFTSDDLGRGNDETICRVVSGTVRDEQSQSTWSAVSEANKRVYLHITDGRRSPLFMQIVRDGLCLLRPARIPRERRRLSERTLSTANSGSKLSNGAVGSTVDHVCAPLQSHHARTWLMNIDMQLKTKHAKMATLPNR